MLWRLLPLSFWRNLTRLAGKRSESEEQQDRAERPGLDQGGQAERKNEAKEEWGIAEIGDVLDGLIEFVPMHLVRMFSGEELKQLMEEGGGRRTSNMDTND